MPKADDPHVVLGVAKGAAVDEIKKAFRARARVLHPDTSDGTTTEEEFHALKAAYEALLKRRGAEADPQDEVYGPGMRARLDAARAWRERSAMKSSGVAPAREWNEINAAASGTQRRASGRAFDAEAHQTLEELLAARRAAKSGAVSSVKSSLEGGFVGGRVGRGSRGLLVVGCGLIIGLFAARKVMHKKEARERVSKSS
jgi:curved DNA-binding protein CbpA